MDEMCSEYGLTLEGAVTLYGFGVRNRFVRPDTAKLKAH